jgi:hypothetical protein
MADTNPLSSPPLSAYLQSTSPQQKKLFSAYMFKVTP